MYECEKKWPPHGNRCGSGKMKPYSVVTDIADGYVQTKEGIYYKGSESIENEEGKRLYFAIYNPEDSCKSVFINKIIVADIGIVGLDCSLILDARAEHLKKESCDVANTNTDCCRKKTCTRIYGEANCDVKGGKTVERFTVSKANTVVRDIGGSILLAPGKYCFIKVKGLRECEVKAACSFEWWEEC